MYHHTHATIFILSTQLYTWKYAPFRLSKSVSLAYHFLLTLAKIQGTSIIDTSTSVLLFCLSGLPLYLQGKKKKKSYLVSIPELNSEVNHSTTSVDTYKFKTYYTLLEPSTSNKSTLLLFSFSHVLPTFQTFFFFF